jgi:hypothetical protein
MYENSRGASALTERLANRYAENVAWERAKTPAQRAADRRALNRVRQRLRVLRLLPALGLLPASKARTAPRSRGAGRPRAQARRASASRDSGEDCPAGEPRATPVRPEPAGAGVAR